MRNLAGCFPFFNTYASIHGGIFVVLSHSCIGNTQHAMTVNEHLSVCWKKKNNRKPGFFFFFLMPWRCLSNLKGIKKKITPWVAHLSKCDASLYREKGKPLMFVCLCCCWQIPVCLSPPCAASSYLVPSLHAGLLSVFRTSPHKPNVRLQTASSKLLPGGQLQLRFHFV